MKPIDSVGIVVVQDRHEPVDEILGRRSVTVGAIGLRHDRAMPAGPGSSTDFSAGQGRCRLPLTESPFKRHAASQARVGFRDLLPAANHEGGAATPILTLR